VKKSPIDVGNLPTKKQMERVCMVLTFLGTYAVAYETIKRNNDAGVSLAESMVRLKQVNRPDIPHIEMPQIGMPNLGVQQEFDVDTPSLSGPSMPSFRMPSVRVNPRDAWEDVQEAIPFL